MWGKGNRFGCFKLIEGMQRLQKSRPSGKSERSFRPGHGSKTDSPLQIGKPKEQQPMVSTSDSKPILIEPQRTSTDVPDPAANLDTYGQRKHENVDDETLRLQRTKTDFETELEQQIAALSKQKNEVQEERDNLLQEQHALKTSLDVLSKANEATQMHNRELKEEVEFLRLDNEKLRTYIATRESDLNPVHPENFYVQSYQALKGEIEMWIAKQAKVNLTTPLLYEDEAKLLETLATLGFYSRASSEILRLQNLGKTWCTNAGLRIQLLRHIVAVFLFDQIFSSFAIGLSPELSEVLTWIDNRILSQGWPRLLLC
jgi:hypothetical protein